MLIAIDHSVFGNGYGLKSPRCDDIYYWLSNEIYTFSHGLGAQLHSSQWTHPRPGKSACWLAGSLLYFSLNGAGFGLWFRGQWYNCLTIWTKLMPKSGSYMLTFEPYNGRGKRRMIKCNDSGEGIYWQRGADKQDAESVRLTGLLCAEDLERVRQWFDAVQDLNEAFLEQEDYQLAKMIYEKLSMRVPKSILNGT